MIEVARAVILESRQRRMFAKHVGGLARSRIPKSPCARATCAKIDPIGARFARRRQKGALARDAALGIRHRAVLFAPGLRGQKHMRAGVDRVVGKHIVGDDEAVRAF